MSRIGKLPVAIPNGVKCQLAGSTLTVTGAKGTLVRTFDPDMMITVSESEVAVARPSDRPDHRAKHGLTRALIQNMVIGASQGFEKTLTIVGVGYRASMQGKTLNLQVGHSHPVAVEPPDGITFAVEGTTTIKVAGIDREQVGQVSADIRAIRKPEPYKGKGIRYADENVRRKVGKAGAK